MASKQSPDPESSRERLLKAAFAEFTAHGLAGGRVDRIAEAAGCNKRLIYLYFTDKNGLFDAVVSRHIEAMMDGVSFDADDLPAYAGRLFDWLYDRPDVLRLFGWRNLETDETSDVERLSYDRKLQALTTAADKEKLVSGIDLRDLLTLVIGMVTAWARPSPALLDTVGRLTEAPVRQRARASLVAAVELLAPVQS
ncbi:TetR/AcrR family transcriptional regulator [Amycolatopsis jejuensis]|uniref:TetR/AcrR family transcriptional regulator n=1 Tax=Amycolatopsis jejuensis TaxID=330084 RepID=UPI000527E30D|nr:TetR family transcriptional regulator [Amycolatopsis jejuensis]